MRTEYSGLLMIGDPHLATRTPGFRSDDYPRTILAKLRWCIEYAHREDLLPVILGDLFHWPRDNANWLLVELMDILHKDVQAIPGNHDCHENTLGPHDSLMLLYRANRLRLLDRDGPLRVRVQGHRVCLGGTAWGQALPTSFAPASPDELVVWITHHDIAFSGPALGGIISPHPIPGIDLVVNGHIHCQEPTLVHQNTTWINPGNIARLSRDEAVLHHRPAALRLDLSAPKTWTSTRIGIPHQPHREVFYEDLTPHRTQFETMHSAFVDGLEELAARRTEAGAGLVYFLHKNLERVDENVADAIRDLAREVLPDEHPWKREESKAGHQDAQKKI